MTQYDTSAQRSAAQSRRLLGAVGTGLLLLAAVYYFTVFLRDGGSTYNSAASFSLALTLLFLILTLVPLSLALGNHPHPSSIEVTDSALVLRYPGGRTDRRAWESGPVDTALDTREGEPAKRRPVGLEATLWISMPGRHPGTTAVRLSQVVVSAHAFDEIRRRILAAGFEERVDAKRKVGTFWRYEKPPLPSPRLNRERPRMA